ncbi:DNA-binding response regulator [Staphylococcus condimenti]|uniref:Response regulator transcription factor n=1 Tax=Staphylococcus condimenti TaxID=70255 RepID=A0AB37HDY0_9STAP|nr:MULTISPECIES: response regulator transcription factor [Staphylococcus]AMY04457.1 DNA-binding response regulator [Staphylococcus condimenti]APR60694.1 DNA-binding response regulator [Staphylococcus condimenti]MDK8646273.1 response regulator transcription factor [Staphylococcus condimenti]OFP01702.1 DNA-binding response regulator [Staphylococcus sp. HMSC065E08]PNZ58658.1 DNA-binding response regulator [Staphylococcus condimenti]
MANRVTLIDDHYIVRQGLEFLISTIEDLTIEGSYSNGKQFFEELKAQNIQPDIVLLDLVMPEMNGIEVTEKLKKEYPSIKILVLTSYADDEHVISAINKGADGYEMKDVEPDVLIESIHKVLEGAKIIHPEVQKVIEDVAKKPHHINKLSNRETEVLKEMAKGKTNKEIAETLFVSEKTVKTHVSHIFSKLQVTDRTQAAIYAMENKLI